MLSLSERELWYFGQVFERNVPKWHLGGQCYSLQGFNTNDRFICMITALKKQNLSDSFQTIPDSNASVLKIGCE